MDECDWVNGRTLTGYFVVYVRFVSWNEVFLRVPEPCCI